MITQSFHRQSQIWSHHKSCYQLINPICWWNAIRYIVCHVFVTFVNLYFRVHKAVYLTLAINSCAGAGPADAIRSSATAGSTCNIRPSLKAATWGRHYHTYVHALPDSNVCWSNVAQRRNDSNVGWANVGPTWRRQFRRWANIGPTYIAVWVVFYAICHIM